MDTHDHWLIWWWGQLTMISAELGTMLRTSTNGSGIKCWPGKCPLRDNALARLMLSSARPTSSSDVRTKPRSAATQGRTSTATVPSQLSARGAFRHYRPMMFLLLTQLEPSPQQPTSYRVDYPGPDQGWILEFCQVMIVPAFNPSSCCLRILISDYYQIIFCSILPDFHCTGSML